MIKMVGILIILIAMIIAWMGSKKKYVINSKLDNIMFYLFWFLIVAAMNFLILG